MTSERVAPIIGKVVLLAPWSATQLLGSFPVFVSANCGGSAAPKPTLHIEPEGVRHINCSRGKTLIYTHNSLTKSYVLIYYVRPTVHQTSHWYQIENANFSTSRGPTPPLTERMVLPIDSHQHSQHTRGLQDTDFLLLYVCQPTSVLSSNAITHHKHYYSLVNTLASGRFL